MKVEMEGRQARVPVSRHCDCRIVEGDDGNKRVHTGVLMVIVVSFLLMTSCSEDKEMTTEIVTAMIKDELVVGAAANDIEAFFEERGLPYTYDRFAKRYQSIIRDVSSDPKVDQAIVIYIYVDDEKQFIREEVIDSFTTP